MRPLPRLHAITDSSVVADPELAIRAAAIASAGPVVALHARNRAAGGRALTELTARFLALVRPTEASVFVNGRADIARAETANGLQLGQTDLPASEARNVLGPQWRGWVGVSVHSLAEAERAARDGADYLLVGHVFDTGTHPGKPAVGLGLVRQAVALGKPVIAIGGITPERVPMVRQAGAWGVAAISALWRAADSARAALAMLEPWSDA